MRILVVSDGRRGIENQALGLANAVSHEASALCDIAIHRLTSGPLFSALPPRLQLLTRQSFDLPDADLVIGCGRQAIASLIALRRSQPEVFTCYVQHPRIDPTHFNLVVAPDHDGLTGPNVETMIGSPNRVTKDVIAKALTLHADRLRQFPGPRAMIVIGGPSQTHRIGVEAHTAHLNAAQQLLDRGYRLLITTSRRTPDAVQHDWKTLADQSETSWLHTPDSPADNPYFAFLGAADIILVTEDSTNMLTEGCATGKPIFRLPMEGQPGKFATLYTALEVRCHVQQWTGEVMTESYAPLDETARIADIILSRIS